MKTTLLYLGRMVIEMLPVLLLCSVLLFIAWILSARPELLTLDRHLDEIHRDCITTQSLVDKSQHMIQQNQELLLQNRRLMQP